MRETDRLRSSKLIASTVAVFLSLAGSRVEAVVSNSFESPEPTWKVGRADCNARVDTQLRTFSEAHSGNGCEYFRYWVGQGGSQFLISQSIEPARVIDELVPSLWLKSNRGGLRLLVRVVLPRSKDPKTGRPLTQLLQGESYETPGRWQQLRVESLASLLKNQVRLLRSRPELGPGVDDAEAYIDQVVVNAYTPYGNTELWLDDLEISGFARALRLEVPDSVAGSDPGTGVRAVSGEAAVPVEVRGSLIYREGRPFFARVIEWQGESLARLAELGFNVVWLPEPPNDEQTAEAERLQLWFAVRSDAISRPTSSRSLRRILCWTVGDRLTAQDLTLVSHRVGQLRRIDPDRPILCDVAQDFSRVAGLADIVLLARNPIASSFELVDSASWWRERGGRMRPAKPFWAGVQTEFTAAHLEQIQSLSQQTLQETDVEPEQIWLQTMHAAAAGARGILFYSDSRLDREDRSGRRRAAALQVANQHLRRIEPWIAAGRAGKPLDLRSPRFLAVQLEAKRSSLVIVCRTNADQQYVVGPGDRSAPLFVRVPGKRTSDQVFRITGAGPQDLTAASVGGTIRLEHPGLFSFLVLTNDQLFINQLGRTADLTSETLVGKETEIVALQHEETEDVLRALSDQHRARPDAAMTLQQTAPLIEQARHLLLARDYASTQRVVHEVGEQLRKLRKEQWSFAAGSFPSAMSSPLCTSFRTLPSHWDTAKRMQASHWGPNEMAAGGFESLPHLLGTGWLLQLGPNSGVSAKVELTLETANTGRSALKLQSWATSPGNRIENWPVWITSAPVPVRKGQVVKIQGSAKVPNKVGGFDGLLIYDSLTGVEQADRIRETKGWRPFLLYRVAPSSGELTIVIALTGVGSAYVDDLEVSLLQPTRVSSR